MLLCGLTALAGPRDEAMKLLAEGRSRSAVSVLEQAVASGEGELSCLLASVHRIRGEQEAALAVLAEDASCGRQADWIRAEALLSLERPEEAAALYADLGTASIGPERGRITASRLVVLADRLLERPDVNGPQVAQALSLALGLPLQAADALPIARKLADATAAHGGDGGAAVGWLIAALQEDDTRADRLRLARLLRSEALLAPLQDDPEILTLRIRLTDDLHRSMALTEALIAGWPDASETQDARVAVGASLADAGWILEAEALLEPVSVGFSTTAEAATWRLLQLRIQAGDPDTALTQIDSFLQRFPRSTHRTSAEAALLTLRLKAARQAAARGDAEVAMTHYAAVVSGWPGDPRAGQAALEAALVLAETGEKEDAWNRLEEVGVRWPGSDAAQTALKTRFELQAAEDSEAAYRWLAARAEKGGVGGLLALVTSVELAVESPADARPGRPISVDVVSRNLTDIEVKLHRIAPEAWLRDGGRPESIDALDVGIIAPDRRWSAEVPRPTPYRLSRWTLPLPISQPGLYAVTVSSTERTATTILQVTDTGLMVKAVGDELVIGVLRGRSPAAGASVWVRGDDGVVEAKTGSDGLARVPAPVGEAMILASSPSGPAVLVLSGHATIGEKSSPQIILELDRAAYRPGDAASFRIITTHPIPGDWRIWLDAGENHPRIETSFSRDGSVITGTLPVPLSNRIGSVTLKALPSGELTPLSLGQVQVSTGGRVGRQLDVFHHDEGMIISVTEGNDLPAVSAPVQWRWRERGGDFTDAITDAAGRVTIPVPDEGLPFTVEARLPGTDLEASSSRSLPWTGRSSVSLRLPQDRLTASEPVVLSLSGQGAVSVVVVENVVPPSAAPPTSPVPGITAGLSPVRSDVPTPVGIRRTLSRTAANLEGATTVTLPALPVGEYAITVLDERGWSVSTAVFSVRDGARIGVISPVGLGQTLTVPVEGGPALVTVLTEAEPTTAMLINGTLRLPVKPSWPGVLTIDMVASDGSTHTRNVSVDRTPEVKIETVFRDGAWRLDARVLDAMGRPMAASVMLRAVDPRVEVWAGKTVSASEGPLEKEIPPGLAWKVASRFSHGAFSAAISPRLLEERVLLDARERARRAVTGDLEDNAIAGLLMTGVPLSGDLWSRGSGAGGGGFGSGIGGLGSMGYGSGVSGYGQSREIIRAGIRGPLLWSVQSTDADGRVSVILPDLPERADLRLDVVAVVEGSIGTAGQLWRDPRPLLRMPTLAAADTGSAQPSAWILAGDEAVIGTMSVDGVSTDLSVPAHTAAEIPLGELTPGRSQNLTVTSPLLSRTETLRWPRRSDVGADQTLTIPEPWGWIAAQADPWSVEEPGRAAIEAGVILALLSETTEAEQAPLRRRLATLLLGLSGDPGRYADVTGVAASIAAQAEAAAVFPGFVPVIASLDSRVDVTDASLEDRTALLHARLSAGVDITDASLARLLREPTTMDAEDQALLARSLIRLERRDEARDLINGDGPQALLATRELGRRVKTEALLTTSPPVLGSLDRVAWSAALPRRHPRNDTVLRYRPDTAHQLGTLASGHRAPLSITGRLVKHPAGAIQECDPCRILPGESLRVRGSLVGVAIPGGLVAESTSSFRAVVPGRYRIDGIHDSGEPVHLWVEVGEDAMPVSDNIALTRAREALEVGEDPGPWVAAYPTLEDWPVALRGQAATLRLMMAVEAGDGRAAFEDLRELRPDARLSVETLAAIAVSYQSSNPEQAIGIWRAAVGRSFLDEAERVGQLSTITGPLAAIQVLQEVALRYPHVPVVEQALFDLPDRLVMMAESGLPVEVAEAGVIAVDVQLMAAAWSREFVLLHPESPLAPQAGLRLSAGLLELGAAQRSADWAQRMLTAWPDHPLTDRLLLVEGLARAASEQDKAARARLEAVLDGGFLLEDGTRGDSAMVDEARLALARLHESGGAYRLAARRYRDAGSDFSEAQASLSVLERTELSVAPSIVTTTAETARLTLQVAGIEELTLRAYALDLRTLFLRDGGLAGIPDLQIAGVAPAWQGRHALSGRPFPEEVRVRLPLSGPGAWLVQVEGGGQTTTTLVVRSDLTLEAVDAGDVRRVTVLRRGKPAAGVEVRALSDRLIADTTDARGVAILPAYAPALVFDGEHLAFTPIRSEQAQGMQRDELAERLSGEIGRLREQTRGELAFIGGMQQDGVAIRGL
ncbi:MAG: TolA-binding protein [Myxococcota bacterium]|jgi:TolA-binding protein